MTGDQRTAYALRAMASLIETGAVKTSSASHVVQVDLSKAPRIAIQGLLAGLTSPRINWQREPTDPTLRINGALLTMHIEATANLVDLHQLSAGTLFAVPELAS